MNLKKIVIKNKPFTILLILLFFINTLIRIPTVFEPTYRDDVTFYLTVGRALLNGKVLFRDISDIIISRPGLIYYLAGLAKTVQGFQLLTSIFNSVSLILFIMIVRFLSKNHALLFILGILFILLTSTPIFEGNEPRDELFFTPFILAATFLTIKYFNDSKEKVLVLGIPILTGVLSGLAILIKINTFFNFLAIAIVYEIYQRSYYSIVGLIVGSLVPITIYGVVLSAQGVNISDVYPLITSSASYATTAWRSPEFINSPYEKLLLSLFLTIIIYINKAAVPPFLLVVLLTSVFNITASVLMNVIGLHYTLQAAPYLLISIAAFYQSKTIANKILILTPIFLFGIFHILFHTEYRFKKTLEYYPPSIKYLTGQIDQEEYNQYFSYIIPRNYEVARILKLLTKPGDQIFVTGVNADIYILSETLPVTKYVWTEHIVYMNHFEQTINEIENRKPDYVVIFEEIPNIKLKDYLNTNYKAISPLPYDTSEDLNGVIRKRNNNQPFLIKPTENTIKW